MTLKVYKGHFKIGGGAASLDELIGAFDLVGEEFPDRRGHAVSPDRRPDRSLAGRARCARRSQRLCTGTV